MKKISVIIPVYNGQETIEKCITSIINQKYRDLEIIIINDGSNDDTQSILERYKKSDSRIIVKNIENHGVSHARNVALNIATGDYITFVDADDYVYDRMYIELVDLIEKNKVDIAHCSYTNVYSDGRLVPVGDTGKVVVQNHDEALSYLIQGKMFAGGNWNKLYSAKLFRDLRFDESIRFNEDVWVCFQAFDNSNASIYYDKAYYYYVANENSATHTIDSLTLHEQIKEIAGRIMNASEGKPYFDLAKKKYSYTILDLYRTYLLARIKGQKRKNLKQEVRVYKELYISKNERLTYLLSMYFPHICVLTYKIYDKLRVKKLDPEQ
jgi:glycosyltransferase involved in cell wall biosynthesis